MTAKGVLLGTALVLLLGIAPIGAKEAPSSIEAMSVSGLEALLAQAKAGDGFAALVAGRQLADRLRSDAEHQQAVALLGEAAQSGIAEASSRLGDIYRNGISGVVADLAKAVEYYERALTGGDNNARRNLAAMLLNGQGVTRDPARAVKLLEDAMNTGNVDARLMLAGMYARGDGVKADGSRALELYQAGLAEKNGGALNGVASLYRRGTPGFAADPEMARGYFELAYGLGDTGAGRLLADMMLRGEGQVADPAGGVALLETIAAKDPWAYYGLGDYFASGQLVPKDSAKAAAYFEQAGEKGLSAGYGRLGDMYRNGAPLLPVDATKAYGYYEKSAALGDQGAKRRLAELLARGEGVSQDVAAGVAQLEAIGDGQAFMTLGDLFSRGGPVPVDGQRAIAYYEAAGAQGVGYGYSRAADFYRSGLGAVPADMEKAVGFLQKAAAAGDGYGRRSLANVLFEGKALPADPAQALELLKAALDAGDGWSGIDLGNAYARGAAGAPDYEGAKMAFETAEARGVNTARWRMALAIINGPLAAEHSPEALAALREAVDAHSPGAAVELAKLQVAGKAGDEGVTDALGVLAGAPDDANAVRMLVALYRDGSGEALKPDLDKAISALSAGEAALGAESASSERLTINLAAPTDAARYPQMASDFKLVKRDDGIRLLRVLRDKDENGYIYVLQSWLKGAGYFAGSPSGSLTKSTITAINKACAAADKAANCQKGPLTPEAGAAIETILFPPPVATNGA
jgi:TPR repeat protein